MKRTHLRLQWKAASLAGGFRSGVSLHGHTHFSRESLGFIERVAARVGLVRAALDHGRRRYGSGFDLSRGWWTPPLVPHAAYDVEVANIQSLGLAGLVSLTDHDTIEAPLSLRVMDAFRDFPISVEWTVPWLGTFFHLGVHNLPARIAQSAMQAMAAYTARPVWDRLVEMLGWLVEDPSVLIVLNHPLWDEGEIGPKLHMVALERLMVRCGAFIHALELNGLRPWRENSQVTAVAEAWNRPVISGGDRHGLEPNTILNLSHASTFSEFVDEVRRDGFSEVLVTAPYRLSFCWRIVEHLLDVVADHESHGLGWRGWDERVFYTCDDGVVRSLHEIWGDNTPGPVRHFTGMLRAVRGSWLQRTLRTALAGAQEVAI